MSQCQHWLAGQIPGKQRLTRLPPSCVSHSGLVAADVSEPQQQQQKPLSPKTPWCNAGIL